MIRQHLLRPCRFPDAVTSQVMRPEDTFFAPCPSCCGVGEYGTKEYREDRTTGAVSYQVVICEMCDGKGYVEEEAPQLEMDERE